MCSSDLCKKFPEDHKVQFAKWNNKKDEQTGLKYLFLRTTEESSPFDPAIEVFEARSHKAVKGGYFSQKLVNGDQVESRSGEGGTPHGPARITTASGQTILGATYHHGELRNLPPEYLESLQSQIQARKAPPPLAEPDREEQPSDSLGDSQQLLKENIESPESTPQQVLEDESQEATPNTPADIEIQPSLPKSPKYNLVFV